MIRWSTCHLPGTQPSAASTQVSSETSECERACMRDVERSDERFEEMADGWDGSWAWDPWAVVGPECTESIEESRHHQFTRTSAHATQANRGDLIPSAFRLRLFAPFSPHAGRGHGRGSGSRLRALPAALPFARRATATRDSAGATGPTLSLRTRRVAP